MNRELVIRIKVGSDSPHEIRELADLLGETAKPGWQLKIQGWRNGQRSLSDRAIALMLDAIKVRSAADGIKVTDSETAIVKQPMKIQEENPFG